MTHTAIVTESNNGQVTVQIESLSACASCQAHARCGFAESKTKTLAIPHPHWKDYTPGEEVLLDIDTSRGLRAVLIAYILPAFLLLAVIIGLSLAHLPEWAVILVAFAALGLYVLLLFLMRHRLDNRFKIKISKDPNKH